MTSTDAARTVHGRGAESRTQTETETKRRTGQSGSDSVRSGWHLEADQAGVVAAALLTLRPDWRYEATRDALRHDPRPWRTVVAAALTCALDPQAHPRLIEHTTARRFEAEQAPTPIPPPLHEVLAAQRALTETT